MIRRLVVGIGAGVAVAAALGVASSAGCSPISSEVATSQPLNTCPDHPCDAYKNPSGLSATCACVAYQTPGSSTPTSCEERACITSTDTKFLLRADLPTGSDYGPGVSFVFDPTIKDSIFGGTCLDPNNSNLVCLLLPSLKALNGSLLVSYATTQAVGFNLGNGPGSSTTLPVTATVTPLLSFGTPATLVDARSAGVLLEPPVVQEITLGNLGSSGEYPGAANGTGINASQPVGYYASVEAATYDVMLDPAPPFDAYFPPYSLGSTNLPNNGNSFFLVSTMDTPSSHTTNVRSAAALDGLVAYLRNSAGERISTRVALHGQDTSTGVPLLLQTTQQPADLSGDFFVIAPADETDPQGRATFTNTAISVTSGGLGAVQTYPLLPSPVTVAGQVLSSGLVPVAADVFLTSTGIDRVDQSAPDDTSLSYATSVTTDACGNYSVQLPPGTYSARVVPHPAGATSCTQTASTAADPLTTIPSAQTVVSLAVATNPEVQNGKTLQLADALPFTGSCMVADGRLLAAATVILTASTALAAAPSSVPAPRTFTTSTRTSGAFMLYVDPGEYDVTIQPAAGSNLPWVVTTRQTVVAPGFALAEQVVPAPIVKSYTLYQRRDSAIVPGALVTAYAFPAGGAADAGPASMAAVPVAQGTTDSAGTVNLLFAGTPQ